MLEMDVYDEPDPDSDLDYEESYSKSRKKKRASGRVSCFINFQSSLTSKDSLVVNKKFEFHVLFIAGAK